MTGEPHLRPFQVQAEPPNSLRIAGWAFTVGSLAAFTYILFPLRLMDPEWEFAAMAQLTDNAMLPLLGIALVLHGRTSRVTPRELACFRGLVVYALALGLLFAGLIPLAVTDSELLEGKLETQLLEMDRSEAIRMAKVEKQLAKAGTIQELRVLGIMLSLKPALGEPPANPAEELRVFRKRLQEQIDFTHTEHVKQSRERHALAWARIVKDSIKIIVVGLLASVFYFWLGFKNAGLFRAHGPDTASAPPPGV